MLKKSVLAVASLLGTIIGAGVFGIPYVMAQSGVLTCFFYFLILGTTVLLLHLFFGEVVLRTKEKHRLVGYTEKYLGKKAKALVGLATLLGTTGALLAYIILAGKFMRIIFPSFLSPLQWSLILWAVLSLFVFWGIKTIASLEFFMGVGLFLVIFLVFGFSIPKIELPNFSFFNSKHIFLPFGVLLFSLVGWSAVPEIRDVLKKKTELKWVIITSLVIAVVFYFLFGVIISGVTGEATTQEAFQGLVPLLGHKVMVLGGIFGLLSVATSFLILGNYLKNTLVFDYRVQSFLAFALACLAPLALFLLGARNFIQVISVVGTFIGLIEGVVIALIFLKLKKRKGRVPKESLNIPRLVVYFTIAILTLGTISQIIYHFI